MPKCTVVSEKKALKGPLLRYRLYADYLLLSYSWQKLGLAMN